MAQLGGQLVAQLPPAGVERFQPALLQSRGDVVVVDADRGDEATDAIEARSRPARRACSRPSRNAPITSSYLVREKIRVTLTLMPSARQAAMAGSPCRAAGILMNRLGRSTRHHSARASAMVASVS